MAIGIRKKLEREPLHTQIAEIIRNKIKDNYKPGERLESESKLAASLGVSVPTVREALSTLALEGFIERRHGSGTYIAEMDDRRHVAIFSELDILHPATSWYYLQVIRELRQYLEDRNTDTIVYLGHTRVGEKPTGRSCPELISALKGNRISCLFLWSMDSIPKYIASNLAKDVPVVGGASGFKHCIILDSEGLVREGVDVLAGQGCGKIAFMGSIQHSTYFSNAMKEKGLAVDRKLIADDFNSNDTESCIRSFKSIMQDKDNQPDGILIGEDTIYFKIEPYLLKSSIKVPEKLKIVSHSNKGDLQAPFLPIILLQFDPEEYAVKAGEMISGLLSKKPDVPSSMLLGFTTAKVKTFA